MKIVGLLALCALSASCASLAQEGGEAKEAAAAAAGAEDYSRRGKYGGFSFIQGFEDFDVPGGASADDSDLGIGLRGGVRLDRNWAVEGVFESIPGYEIGAGPFDEDLDMMSVGAQGKYFFTTDKVQPYALAGIGLVRADVDRFDLDDSGTYFRVGGGAEVHLTRDVAAFGELTYTSVFGDIHELDYAAFQVGLIFRF